jgi:hypothetical protein
MNRTILALAGALITVPSACIAQPANDIHFMLERERGNPAKIHASFRDETRDRDHNSWSTGFAPSDLFGLELASFHAAGARPLRFAVVREAGRLDCAGNGGNDYAAGYCRFTADPTFTQLLVSRGIGRPTRDQAFGLTAVNARRETIDALGAARYPTPSIDDLMALAALGADGRYIMDMGRAGYRPASIHSLIEFKAMGITPQWISGFARVGYANVPGDGLVQMRALGVTPEYIAAFQRLGYRNLPVSKLVEMKALDITPEFVRSTVGPQAAIPPVNELVQMKVLGGKR